MDEGLSHVEDLFNRFSFVLFQGGFKLQLLDVLDRPVLDLTPTINGSDYIRGDAT